MRAGAGSLAALLPGVAILAGAIAVGTAPTLRWAGQAGVTSMLAGCGASLAGAALAAVPLARRTPGAQGLLAAWGAASLLRFSGTLAAALITALATEVAPQPFFVWVGVSYLALLAGETLWLTRRARRVVEENDGS